MITVTIEIIRGDACKNGGPNVKKKKSYFILFIYLLQEKGLNKSGEKER